MAFVNPAMVADLEQLQRRVYAILVAMEHLRYEDFKGGAPEQEEQWQAAIKHEESELEDSMQILLESLATRMLVYADALGLRQITTLIQDWKAKWWGKKLRDMTCWSSQEGYGFESHAFAALGQILDPMLVLTRPPDALPPAATLRGGHEILEHALRSLAKLCRERKVVPAREHDVQRVLHSHLEGIFPDYVRTLTIGKPLVSFKPDGGIPSLQTAIECKYVASEGELKTAIHGITEDLSGYRGSRDWTKFYTVCYMTEAFAVEGQLVAALGASGNAGSWTTVLVTGPGTRTRRKTARTPARKTAARGS